MELYGEERAVRAGLQLIEKREQRVMGFLVLR
jgi:hypothetical protein